MPLYFAYGANMAVAAMAQRCPSSRALGVARLPRHQLFITADGFASVRRSARDQVYGVAWELALSDVATLDRFEGVDHGLYRKAIVPVLIGEGNSRRAMAYIGSSTQAGAPLPGYLETIIAAAQEWRLPSAYCATLAALAPAQGATRLGPRFENVGPRAARA